jgi:hypothetical protein
MLITQRNSLPGDIAGEKKALERIYFVERRSGELILKSRAGQERAYPT